MFCLAALRALFRFLSQSLRLWGLKNAVTALSCNTDHNL